MKKRLLSIAMVLMMCITMVPATVFAEGELPGISNVNITADGMLTWDAVAGASHYSITIKPTQNKVVSFSVTSTSLDVYSEINGSSILGEDNYTITIEAMAPNPDKQGEYMYIARSATNYPDKFHKTTFVAEVPALCERDGVKAHYKCTDGDTFEDERATKPLTDLTIPATGHVDADNDGICDKCGDVIKYLISKGQDQTVIKGEETDITITCNGRLDALYEIQVDGSTLDASNYSLKSGSTILTLKKSYLETLSVGKHTVSFLYKGNNSASTSLTVAAAQVAPPVAAPEVPEKETTNTDSPDTGDHGNLGLWVTVMLVAMAAMVVYVVSRRRSNHNR